MLKKQVELNALKEPKVKVLYSLWTPFYNWLGYFVLALTALIYSTGLEHLTVQRFDESHYILNAFDVLENGNWLVQKYQGEWNKYNFKPPLFTWMLVGAFSLFGKNIVAARLVTAFFAWATGWLLYTYFKGKKWPLLSILSPLILMLTPGWFEIHAARTADTDVTQAFFFVLSCLLLNELFSRKEDAPYFKNWRWYFYFLSIVAFSLIRGLPSLVFPFIALLSLIALYKPAFKKILFAAFVFFIASIPLFIYYFLRWRIDPDFLKTFYELELQRATIPIHNHEGPWWYYLEEAEKKDFRGTWPIVVFAFIYVLQIKKKINQFVGLGLMAFTGLAFLSLAATKCSWYDVLFIPLFVSFTTWSFFLLYEKINGPSLKKVWIVWGIVLLFVNGTDVYTKHTARFNSEWPNEEFQNQHYYKQLLAMDTIAQEFPKPIKITVSWPEFDYYDELSAHIKFLNIKNEGKPTFEYKGNMNKPFKGHFLYFNNPEQLSDLLKLNKLVWAYAKKYNNLRLYVLGKEVYNADELNTYLKVVTLPDSTLIIKPKGKKLGDDVSFGPYIQAQKGNYLVGFKVQTLENSPATLPFIFQAKDATKRIYFSDTISLSKADDFTYKKELQLSTEAYGLELVIKHGVDATTKKITNNFGLKQVFIHPFDNK